MKLTRNEFKEILEDAIANCQTEIGLGNGLYWEEKKIKYEQLLEEIPTHQIRINV